MPLSAATRSRLAPTQPSRRKIGHAAFGNAGRLWAVSEPGRGISTTIPSSTLFQSFFPLVFALDLSRDWSESDYMPPPAVGWDLEFESGSLHRRVCELSVPAETKRLLLRFGAGLGNS